MPPAQSTALLFRTSVWGLALLCQAGCAAKPAASPQAALPGAASPKVADVFTGANAGATAANRAVAGAAAGALAPVASRDAGPDAGMRTEVPSMLGDAAAHDAAVHADAGIADAAIADRAAVTPAFILGADLSSVQEHHHTFIDTDGKAKGVFELLKHHGFNYVRVKAFVDPSAPRGYASEAGGCMGLSEPFGDREHVIAFGRQIRQAGMGFLLDLHYSDTWADPGKQIIPAAWRSAASISELAAHVRSYTRQVLMAALAAGARPDMVQVGNEITPGMLMHVPGANTDCWGNKSERAPLGGSTDNWDNLATLLRAGIEAVRELDPTIQVMLHLESTDDLSATKWWLDNALQRKLSFDVLGLSCYVAFQGEPTVWQATFEALAKSYPQLRFVIAEYNPERKRANLIMRGLPDGRGLGTFLWEPTRSGAWGESLFVMEGETLTAKPADFAELDALRPTLGL